MWTRNLRGGHYRAELWMPPGSRLQLSALVCNIQWKRDLRVSLGSSLADLNALGLQAVSDTLLWCRERHNPPLPTRVPAPAHWNLIQNHKALDSLKAFSSLLRDHNQLPSGEIHAIGSIFEAFYSRVNWDGMKWAVWGRGAKGGVRSHTSIMTISSICQSISSQCQAPVWFLLVCKVLRVDVLVWYLESSMEIFN